MRKITDSTNYIIGIDFGHGETAAALYNIRQEVLQNLDILPGRHIVKSMVAIETQENDECIVIGDSVNNHIQSNKVRLSFKRRPSEMSHDDKELQIAFMKGVYQNILNQNVFLNNENHVVYIARPSSPSWDNEEAAYVQMATDAGIPVAGIHKESRAAFFQARKNVNNNNFGDFLRKGVLIVDFGSSTLDFTYLNDRMKMPIDFGSPGTEFGANSVETMFMRHFLDTSDKHEIIMFNELYGMNEKSKPYNLMLFDFRKSKENYYSGGEQAQWFTSRPDLLNMTSGEENQIDCIARCQYSREQVNQLLESYIEGIRTLVKDFKEKELKEQNVSFVFLTGGASRMDFVKGIFRELFNLDASCVESDNDPSSIVARGIALLSYADYITKKREEELRGEYDRIINEFNWEEELRKVISPIVKKDVVDIVDRRMLAWKSGNIYSSESSTKIHSVKALKTSFENALNVYSNFDFISLCRDTIQKELVTKVIEKVKNAFVDYRYNGDFGNFDSVFINLTAILNASSIRILTDKFTANGAGHIIYDAVVDFLGSDAFMLDINETKDRWPEARHRHYNFYLKKRNTLFNDDEWKIILDGIQFTNLNSIKSAVIRYLDRGIENYISYARLEALFN